MRNVLDLRRAAAIVAVVVVPGGLVFAAVAMLARAARRASMRMNYVEKVERIVSEYLEEAADRVEVYPDPEVAGTYAVRAHRLGAYPVDLLVHTNAADPTDAVAEVEFKTWPPTAGGRPVARVQ